LGAADADSRGAVFGRVLIASAVAAAKAAAPPGATVALPFTLVVAAAPSAVGSTVTVYPSGIEASSFETIVALQSSSCGHVAMKTSQHAR
jgi:hypothetical protein